MLAAMRVAASFVSISQPSADHSPPHNKRTLAVAHRGHAPNSKCPNLQLSKARGSGEGRALRGIYLPKPESFYNGAAYRFFLVQNLIDIGSIHAVASRECGLVSFAFYYRS